MNINEFTENVKTLLNHGIYYHGRDKHEPPVRVNKISDTTVMVEFFDPRDTFMVTMERRHEDG